MERKEIEIKQMSVGFRELWKLDRKGLATKERNFVKLVGGLIYELGYRLENIDEEDFDFRDWIESQDNVHNLGTELWKIQQLVEAYEDIFHMIDTTVAHSDSGLNKDDDIKLLKQ